MKNLKKFAALLLAGAMALLMLTACGGGGGDFGKRDPDAEARPLTDLRQRHRQVA